MRNSYVPIDPPYFSNTAGWSNSKNREEGPKKKKPKPYLGQTKPLPEGPWKKK